MNVFRMEVEFCIPGLLILIFPCPVETNFTVNSSVMLFQARSWDQN